MSNLTTRSNKVRIACPNPQCPKPNIIVSVPNESIFCSFCKHGYGSVINEVMKYEQAVQIVNKEREMYFVSRFGIFSILVVIFLLSSAWAVRTFPIHADFVATAILILFLSWFGALAFFGIRSTKLPYPDHPQMSAQ